MVDLESLHHTVSQSEILQQLNVKICPVIYYFRKCLLYFENILSQN